MFNPVPSKLGRDTRGELRCEYFIEVAGQERVEYRLTCKVEMCKINCK